MNTFVITGARIVTPNEVIDNGFLYVKKGIIEAIDVVSCQRLHRSLNRINGRGMWLLPGIVNICDRSLEKELTESNIPLGIAFIAAENNLAGCGITTVNHILLHGFDQVSDRASEIKRLRKYSAIRHEYYTMPVSDNEPASIYGNKPNHNSLPYSCLNAAEIMRNGIDGSHGSRAGVKTMYAEVLYSDSRPFSILHSIFSLAANSDLGMPESVKLATLNPARVLGIDRKLGSLEVGKIADMILVKEIDGIEIVEKVFVDGYKVLEKRNI